MTQPEPAQPRHTADTITDDALTALYDERDELRALLHDAEGDRDSWARDARRAEREAEAEARKAHTDLIAAQKRAGRAEDALGAVRKLHQPTEGLGWEPDQPDKRYGHVAQACTSCGTSDEFAVRWPCPTAQIIDRHQAQETT